MQKTQSANQESHLFLLELQRGDIKLHKVVFLVFYNYIFITLTLKNVKYETINCFTLVPNIKQESLLLEK